MPYSDKKILVVDDDHFLISIIRQILQPGGYQVHAVLDGVEALKLARVVHFDLVLLDASMPGMDGFEVLKRLKANPALRDLPVLMLTGLRSATDVKRATACGADGYVTKPFRPDQLLPRINKIFERRRQPPPPAVEYL